MGPPYPRMVGLQRAKSNGIMSRDVSKAALRKFELGRVICSYTRVFEGAHIAMTATRFFGRVLRCALLGTVFLLAAAFHPRLDAETGAEAWLRYSVLSSQAAKNYETLPGKIVLLSDRLVLKTAQQELVRGVSQMLGKTLIAGVASPLERSIVLGTLTDLHALAPRYIRLSKSELTATG